MSSYHGRQISSVGLRMFSRSCSGRIVGNSEVRAEQRVVQEGSSPSGAQRERRRKLDTAKAELEPLLVVPRER